LVAGLAAVFEDPGCTLILQDASQVRLNTQAVLRSMLLCWAELQHSVLSANYRRWWCRMPARSVPLLCVGCLECFVWSPVIMLLYVCKTLSSECSRLAIQIDRVPTGPACSTGLVVWCCRKLTLASCPYFSPQLLYASPSLCLLLPSLVVLCSTC
jgi:hypothetical protein